MNTLPAGATGTLPPGQSSVPPFPRPEQDTISIGGLFNVLWLRKIMIGFVTLIAIFIGGYQAYVVAIPTYRSTSVVMLNSREENILELTNVVSGLQTDFIGINTELEVLKSRNLMTKVVDTLDLVSDPEFNPSLLSIDSPVDDAVTRFKTFVKVLLLGPEAAVPDPPASPEVKAERQRNAAVRSLIYSTSVRVVPESVVFRITVTSGEAEKSALIANTIAETYIRNQLESKFEATEQATTWLSERVADLQVQLEEAEAKVKDFQANTSLVSPEALDALERQLKEQRDRIAGAESILERAEARVVALKAAQTPQDMATVSEDTELNRLLGNASSERGAVVFEMRFAQVLTRAELELSRNQAQFEALRQSAAELEAEIGRQSADLISLQQLTREAEADRLLYEYFLGRFNETSAQQGIQQADSRILSRAQVPLVAATPQRSQMLLVSAFLGIFIGSAIAFLLELRRRGFVTSQDLESATGYAVIGQMPFIAKARRTGLVPYLAKRPSSRAAEAIRNLRTSVLLSDVDNPPVVIAVTSSLPGEGKSNLSLALAQNFAAMGKKVLLIEGDMRRRVFSRYLRLKSMEGASLVKVVSGDVSLGEGVFNHSSLGLDILPADDTKLNAADLFSSDRFSQVIMEAREIYDQVIIDTPPVLLVPDARIIAQSVDTMLMVVRWQSTTREQVTEGLRSIEAAGRKVGGLVLNQIDMRALKRRGYGDTYGAYARYGNKYYRN